jgi:hypothetical protein
LCGSGSGIRSLFDPASGIRDGKIRIRDKHPGSGRLLHGIYSTWYNVIVSSQVKGLQYLEEKERNELANLQEHERHREQVILIS